MASSDQLSLLVQFTRRAETPVECGARQNMCLVNAIAHSLTGMCTRIPTVLTALVEKVDLMRPSIHDSMFIEHASIAKLIESLPTNAGGFVVYQLQSTISEDLCYATRVHTQVWDAAQPLIKILWEPIARAAADATCEGHYMPVIGVADYGFDAETEMQNHARLNAFQVARNDALLRGKLVDTSHDMDYAYALQVRYSDDNASSGSDTGDDYAFAFSLAEY